MDKKRLKLFLMLKITELSIAVAVGVITYLLYRYRHMLGDIVGKIILYGSMVCTALIALSIIGYLIYKWGVMNWKWAGELQIKNTPGGQTEDDRKREPKKPSGNKQKRYTKKQGSNRRKSTRHTRE